MNFVNSVIPINNTIVNIKLFLGKFKLRYGLRVVNYLFFEYGKNYLFFNSSFITDINCDEYVFTDKYSKIIRLFIYNNVFNRFLYLTNMYINGILFGHAVKFVIIGYHYYIKNSYKYKYFFINLGFFYRLCIRIPNSIKIRTKRKRNLRFIGTDYCEFNFFIDYLRNLRNLFPYKHKGWLLKRDSYKLKQGKKVKYR